MLLATVRNHSSMTVFNRDVRAKTTPWNPRLLQPTCVPELVRRSSRCRSTYCGFANAVFLINLSDDWTAHVNSKREKKAVLFLSYLNPCEACECVLWPLSTCRIKCGLPAPRGSPLILRSYLRSSLSLATSLTFATCSFYIQTEVLQTHPSLLCFCDFGQAILLGDIVLFSLFSAK